MQSFAGGLGSVGFLATAYASQHATIHRGGRMFWFRKVPIVTQPSPVDEVFEAQQRRELEVLMLELYLSHPYDENKVTSAGFAGEEFRKHYRRRS